MVEHNPDTKSRLLARLVRELLAAERFETLACLTDALKCRCARLKIRWTNDDISEAYRLIESNRPLLETVVPRRRDESTSRRDERPFSRDEATRILAGLGIRL
jgi:hypothetical protein